MNKEKQNKLEIALKIKNAINSGYNKKPNETQILNHDGELYFCIKTNVRGKTYTKFIEYNEYLSRLK